MSKTKTAQEMAHVPADIMQVLAILRQANVGGNMRSYAESRASGKQSEPDVAQKAYHEAKALVDAAKASGNMDTTVGVSVNILDALMNDVAMYAKVAASRSEIKKLADKFAKALKTK